MVEVQAFKQPPLKVKIGLEPVIALISESTSKPDWATVKEWLKKPNFIKDVLNFDKDSIKPAVKRFIMDTYINKEDEWNVD